MEGFRIIREASFAVMSLCGEQKYNFTRQYRLSDFIFRCEIGDSSLFYSCLTGELVEVTKHEKAFQYLVRHWFYVEKDLNEKENVPKLRKLLLALDKRDKPGYNRFEILTTTNCNANCSYCYENGFKQMSMSKDTAMKVVQYIKNNLCGFEANIRWYGGEPLMNTKAIDWISEGLANQGIAFSSKMISNGYLFSDNIIQKATKNWNLKNVRITLDGAEQTHNKIKQFKNTSQSPFLHIMNNVELLLSAGVSVTIRINVEKHNVEEIKEVVDQICIRFGKTKLLDFMFRPLSNTNRLSTIESSVEARRHIYNRINEIKTYLFEKGIGVNSRELTGLTPHSCSADDRRYLLIKPNGELAFCPEDFDVKQYGSISNGEYCFRPSSYYEYRYDKGTICNDCPLYICCYPNSLCPASKKTVCNEIHKDSILKDLELSIKKEYRNYIIVNN
ncbi:radical SAM protein [Prevotella sp. MA2016]|uniref:radical SAM protein n=1 Tax=Prevotella sp. MA2016 TaxID=1408310 RepID=UPI00048C7F4D|nr:radical SAM protein [Prevotella sp. MA2016]